MTLPDTWLTVVLPTYNGAAYIRETLDSLVAQNEGGFEVIAIDEASSDGTPDIIASYANRIPIRQIDGADLHGWIAKTNHGFNLARTPYLTMLHQDDVWWPDRMRQLRRALQAVDQPVFLIHAVDFIDEKNRKLGKWSPPGRLGTAPVDPPAMLARLCVQNFIAIPGSVFPRQVVQKVGGIDSAFKFTGDWDFYLRIASEVPSLALQHTLSGYRIHAGALTMAVTADPDLYSAQLSAPLQRHLQRLPEAARDRVGLEANFSNLINVTLANRLHGRPADWKQLAKLALKLGPTGILSYFHNSRIGQRVVARLRAKKLRSKE